MTSFKFDQKHSEISNLVLLSVVDKQAMKERLSSNHQTRMKKFRPAHVRKLVSNAKTIPVTANKDWYSDLCERYVHVTPETKPNMHNSAAARVGYVYQEEGAEKSLSELANIAAALALLICKYFDFDDLYRELLETVRYPEDATGIPT